MLHPDTFAELYSLFSDKKWNEINQHKTVFRRFCNLVANLEEKEIEFILELTKRYTWVTPNDYQAILIDFLKQLASDYKNIKNFYVLPIIRPEDQGKNKSGNVISYYLRAYKPFADECDKMVLKELTTFEEIQEKSFVLKKNEILLLVDDYIGSGETLKACLTEVFKNPNIKKEQVLVLSIMIQKISLEYLMAEKIGFLYKELTHKGISHFYTGKELDEKIKMMTEIEKMIPGEKGFRFGYEESEALVTMIRTPDNTFPIFWKDHKHGREKFKGPFSRY